MSHFANLMTQKCGQCLYFRPCYIYDKVNVLIKNSKNIKIKKSVSVLKIK